MEDATIHWAGPTGPVLEENRTLPAADGYPVAATLYHPGPPGGPVEKAAILGSSLGGDRRRYAPFARFLAGRGWTVATFDCRGIGDSRNGNPRELTVDLVDWADKDVAGVIGWMGEHLAPGRLVGIGHSMGGQLFGLAPNNHALDALLLITSQTNYWRLRPAPWDLLVLLYIGYASVLVATLGKLPLWPSGTESLPPAVARQWRRWALDPSCPDRNGRSIEGRFATYEGPLLSISFSDDPFYSPPDAVGALLELFSRSSSESWHFRPQDLDLPRIGHRGFFQEGLCPGLWERVEDWLATAGVMAGTSLEAAGKRFG